MNLESGSLLDFEIKTTGITELAETEPGNKVFGLWLAFLMHHLFTSVVTKGNHYSITQHTNYKNSFTKVFEGKDLLNLHKFIGRTSNVKCIKTL